MGDASVVVFATKLYTAVGSAQPYGILIEQAVIATEIALSTNMDFATLCIRHEIDAFILKLIETAID